MARFLIVNTDNFGGDYPDEKFVENLPIFTDREDALDVVAAIHGAMPESATRFFKVVEEGYKLQPGFEP